MATLTLTQYLDTLKNIGSAPNSKVIFIDTNINKPMDLTQQLLAAFEGNTTDRKLDK
jgi:hypothetical protein